jgi:hypothetical protein
MITPPQSSTQQTTPSLRKRSRLSEVHRGAAYEEEGERFVRGCQAAKEHYETSFPSSAELAAMEARTLAHRQNMQEVQECVSRAKRILYAMHGISGSPQKHWEFNAEDVEVGAVSVVPCSYRIEQLQEAIEDLEQAPEKVHNALSSTQLDEAKARSLRWVAEGREAGLQAQAADPLETGSPGGSIEEWSSRAPSGQQPSHLPADSDRPRKGAPA